MIINALTKTIGVTLILNLTTIIVLVLWGVQ